MEGVITNSITETVILNDMVRVAISSVSPNGDMGHISVGEIKDFSLCFLPKTDETVHTQISVASRKGKAVVVDACTYVEGEAAAKCRIKLFMEKKDETAGNTL